MNLAPTSFKYCLILVIVSLHLSTPGHQSRLLAQDFTITENQQSAATASPTPENAFRDFASQFEEQAAFIEKLKKLESDQSLQKQRQKIATLKEELQEHLNNIAEIKKRNIREVTADQIAVIEPPLEQKRQDIEQEKIKSAAKIL